MGTYELYKVMYNDLLELMKSSNGITPPKEPESVDYVRLVENPFKLTSEMAASENVVTAHKLSQYRNKFRSIKLESATDPWLKKLVAAHREVN